MDGLGLKKRISQELDWVLNTINTLDATCHIRVLPCQPTVGTTTCIRLSPRNYDDQVDVFTQPLASDCPRGGQAGSHNARHQTVNSKQFA